jgi:3-isopropylmalate dehydratase small subunit
VAESYARIFFRNCIATGEVCACVCVYMRVHVRLGPHVNAQHVGCLIPITTATDPLPPHTHHLSTIIID